MPSVPSSLRHVLVAGALVAALPAAGQAIPDNPDEALTAVVWGQINRALSGGKLDRNTLLISLQPAGLILEEGFSSKNVDDQALLDDVFDTVPKAEALYSDSGNKYWNILQQIYSQKDLPPDKPLTAAEESDYKAALARVDPASEGYRKYLEAEAEYDAARDAYNAARDQAAQTNTRVPASVESAYTRAERAFGPLRAQVFKDYQTIQGYTNRCGRVWWQTLQDRTALFKDTKYSFFPAVENWTKADAPGRSTWTKIRIKTSLREANESANSMSFNGKIGYKSSGVKVGASAAWSKDFAKAMFADSDSKIEFELKTVKVVRNWFPMEIMQDANWGFRGPVVSYGDVVGNSKNPVLMPTYVTKAYLIRNLVISGKFDSSLVDKYEESLKTKVSVSAGGFSLGASFNKHDKREHRKAAMSTLGLRLPAVQLIAVQAVVPPAAPAKTVQKRDH